MQVCMGFAPGVARLDRVAKRTDYDVTLELSDDITEWEILPIIILQ